MTRVQVTVYGQPAPGGSKTSGQRKDGTRFVRDSSRLAAPWKQRVEQAAGEEMAARGLDLLEGALTLVVWFYRPRPRSHYTSKGELNSLARRTPYPITKPDTTKLLRPLEDALRGVVYRDDAQIVEQSAFKRYGAPARACVVVSELQAGDRVTDLGGMRMVWGKEGV